MARLAPLLAALLGALACAPTDPAACAASPHATRGPWPVGVTTLRAADVDVEVWYPSSAAAVEGRAIDVYDMRDFLPPATRARIPVDAPTTFAAGTYRDVEAADDGPFPVVYFSHGLGGYRLQSSAITAHLASWGFVVVAPQHVERDLATVLAASMGEGTISDAAYTQIVAAHERMSAETESGRFAGRLDLSRVAVMGHSAGGGAVQALVDDSPLGASAWIGMATIAAPLESPAPGLLLSGTLDQLATPVQVADLYERDVIADPKRWVAIAGAGHLAFSDICVIGRERGGVLRIAQDAGVPLDDLLVRLATDGCQPEALAAEDTWPIVGNYAVAHLRAAFGITSGSGATGLGPESVACFGERIERFE